MFVWLWKQGCLTAVEKTAGGIIGRGEGAEEMREIGLPQVTIFKVRLPTE